MFKGKQIKDAQVQLISNDFSFDTTDNNGHFSILHVPEGLNELEASKTDQHGVYLSGSTKVTVVGNKDTEVTIELEPPSDLYRAVTIKGSTATTDDEWYP